MSARPIFRTLRFRVKDSTSKKWLESAAHAVNLVWNHCNSMQMHALRHNQRWPDRVALQASTKGSGREIGLPAQVVQEVQEEYLLKRRNAKKAKLRWRGKRSLGWIPFKNQTIRVNSSVVHFNGGKVRLWLHREVHGRIKCGNFSQDARGRWYCNLVVEYEPRPHGIVSEVGIDLGLKAVATLSTGETIEHPRAYRVFEAKLAAAQRANKKRLARTTHAKIANIRRDFLHKETTKLADRFGCIMVGNLSGRWLQATNGKSSADASTGMFRNMLRYKAIARSAVYMDVPEALTTQVCSACGSMPDGRPKGIADLEIRQWTCGDCGTAHDRDVNAARNIARLGRQALAEGALP